MIKLSTNQTKDQIKKIAYRVSTVTIIINALLFAGKLIFGLIGKSDAMVSDAIHTASDVFSTIVVIIGIRISTKASDKDHPFGHERLESVASIVLAVMLGVTGGLLGYGGINKIITGDYANSVPDISTLVVAVISIALNEGMYWYTRSSAKKIKSDMLMADAWHHRSDAISSIGAFIGILGSILGVPIMDSIASLLICLMILKVAIDIFRSAINKLVDKSCDDETISKMKEIVSNESGVTSLDLIRTRMFGNKIYVEIEFSQNENLTLRESHEVAERVHDRIEQEFPNVKHCMVHVNPSKTDNQIESEINNTEVEIINENTDAQSLDKSNLILADENPNNEKE